MRPSGEILRHVLTCGAALLWLLTASVSAAQAPATLADKEETDLSVGLDRLSEPIDRSTPRRSWTAFLEACRKGRWERASHLLNLGDVAVADRKVVGAVTARQLWEVLRQTGQDSAGGLDDTPLGPLAEDKPQNFVVAAKVAGPQGTEELWLRRYNDRALGQHVWVATRQSISQVPIWYRRIVRKETVGKPAVEVVNRGLGPIPRELELDSPRDTVETFVAMTANGEFRLAAHLLDLSAIPEPDQLRRGKRLARRLAIVLKQVHPGGYAHLSNDLQGAPERDVPLDEENVVSPQTGGGVTPIRVARQALTSGSAVWLFSAATVAEIDPLYRQFGYGWAGDLLPPIFIEWQLWGVQLWQWAGIVISVFLAYLLGYLAALLLRRFLRRLTGATSWTWDDALASRILGPLVVGLGVVVFLLLLPSLALAPTPHALLLGACRLLAIIAAGWFLVRVIDIVGDSVFRYFKERGDDMGMAMVPVTRKVLKPIILAIIVIVALQNAGMNVGGLLAGLGIGGLAFALAGKNTIENLFGSIVISFDRPFKIGDFIKVGDTLGTVEDLGLRSTRIRTLERTLVTIPNAQMADAKIENYTRRDRMRLFTTLGLQYDTSPDQIRFIIDELKRYLLAHPQVWQESFAVRFVGYQSYSLDIEVNCWVVTADWGCFTGIRESMFLEMGRIVSAAGAEFAYPSQTIYQGKDLTADEKKAQHAAAVVAQRQAAGELCLPEIPERVRSATNGGQSQPQV